MSKTTVVKTAQGDVGTVVQGTSKDSQKARLYRAEQSVRTYYAGFEPDVMKLPVGDLKAAQKFVDDVLKRKYIQRKYPTRPINVWVKEGAYQWAHACGSNIDLPSAGAWAWNKMVILHEIAHVFERRMNGRQLGGHGWTFAAIFLDILRNVCGKEAADRLKAEYKYNKVKFRAPRKRTMTIEQKDAAAARLEKAREKREKKLKPQRELRDKMMALYKKANTGRCHQNGRWRGRAIWKHMLGDMTIDKSPMNMSHKARVELWARYQKFERERHGPIQSSASFRQPSARETMLQTYGMRALSRPDSFAIITGTTS